MVYYLIHKYDKSILAIYHKQGAGCRVFYLTLTSMVGTTGSINWLLCIFLSWLKKKEAHIQIKTHVVQQISPHVGIISPHVSIISPHM